MFQVETNSKQISWLHSPIIYIWEEYNSFIDGLVLFGLGNDDILARCQILSVWSSFISTLADLFVVTVHNKQVAHALHFWVHLKSIELSHLWESSSPPLINSALWVVKVG